MTLWVQIVTKDLSNCVKFYRIYCFALVCGEVLGAIFCQKIISVLRGQQLYRRLAIKILVDSLLVTVCHFLWTGTTFAFYSSENNLSQGIIYK